jgi:ATP-binding protein involved in chromosome partitioning
MIVREGGDEGVPVVIGHPESPSAMALRALAEIVASRLEALVPAAV